MSDTIKCPTCQAAVPVPDLNVGVINQPAMSMMYITHEDGVECAGCMAYLKPAIVNVPAGTFSWIPADKPVEANRIISPLSLVPH